MYSYETQECIDRVRPTQPFIPSHPYVGQPAMTGEETDSRVAAALLHACRMDVQVAKPGNVSLSSPGHRMCAEDFLRSAQVIAPVLAAPGEGVGERVLRAVEATRAAVGCNTNLGIVLLAAPLCQAVLRPCTGSLRERTAQVLTLMTLMDSEYTYQAIRTAAPGGLGSASSEDVSLPPGKALKAIMREAQCRDRIAWQYANDFEDIFGFGLSRLGVGRERGDTEEWATLAVYLGFLSRGPDTHIQRKHGHTAAAEVWCKAALLDNAFMNAPRAEDLLPRLRAFDTELKCRGYNPGTSADLTVATLLAANLEHLILRAETDGASASPKTGVEGMDAGA